MCARVAVQPLWLLSMETQTCNYRFLTGSLRLWLVWYELEMKAAIKCKNEFSSRGFQLCVQPPVKPRAGNAGQVSWSLSCFPKLCLCSRLATWQPDVAGCCLGSCLPLGSSEDSVSLSAEPGKHTHTPMYCLCEDSHRPHVIIQNVLTGEHKNTHSKNCWTLTFYEKFKHIISRICNSMCV